MSRATHSDRRPGSSGLAAVLGAAALWLVPATTAVGGPPNFGGGKTAWHGFDRYDFLMDEADLSVRPHKAAPDEGDAVRDQVKGHFRCVVVAPKEVAPGNPWSWRGYYFD